MRSYRKSSPWCQEVHALAATHCHPYSAVYIYLSKYHAPQEDMLAQAFSQVISGEDMADWPAMGRAVLALVARHWGGLPGSRQQVEQPQQQAQEQRQAHQQEHQQGQQQQGQQQQRWAAAVPQPSYPGWQHVPLPGELRCCLSHFLDNLELEECDATAQAALQQLSSLCAAS